MSHLANGTGARMVGRYVCIKRLYANFGSLKCGKTLYLHINDGLNSYTITLTLPQALYMVMPSFRG